MTPAQFLLKNTVDYAGLYPPAALPLPEVLRNYASYQHLDAAWMLGRLVMNATDLPAFLGLRNSLPQANWPLSVLVSTPEDWTLLRSLMAQHPLPIKALELKAGSLQDIQHQAGLAAKLGLREVYFEVPLDRLDLLIDLQDRELCAKARLGGTTPQAFPEPDLVLGFLQQCVQLGLPFKLTAGLHHPIRGHYPLTYQPDSVKGTMYGYLNVLLATAFLLLAEKNLARQVLLETAASTIHFGSAGIKYAGVTLASADLSRTRTFLHAFGSCSFLEPSHELTPFVLERNA